MACQNGNEGNGSSSPIELTAEIEPFEYVMGDGSDDHAWKNGDQVGVYVHATKEIPFSISADGDKASLVAVSADIPESYGSDSYACIPATGSQESFLKMKICVPSSQTFSNGHNPNLINSVAYCKVADSKADFRFKQYGAVLAFGFSSSDGVKISSMKVIASAPASGSYLSGSKSLDFTKATEFSVDDNVTGGDNVVEVNFPDGLELGNDTQYVTVATLPFSTEGGGIRLVLSDMEGHTCTLDSLICGNTPIGSGGALNVGAGQFVTYDAGNIVIDDFDIPSDVNVTLADKVTGKAIPDHKVYLYSVSGTSKTLLDSMMTDENGKIEKQVNPGTYELATRYNDNFGPQWNTMGFTAKMNEALSLTFDVIPIVFADDFDWITSDMGGTSKVLKPYYASFNPPSYNSASTDEAMIKESTAVAQAKLADIGWEWTTADYAYLRPGVIKFGKKGSTGSITTPALGKYYPNLPENLLVKVTAISWNNSTDKITWTYENSQIMFTIIGGGSFSATDGTETTYTSGLLNSGTPPDMYTYFSLPIYGATSSTQLKMESVKQTSGTQWRCMIDDIVISPIYN